MTHLFARGVAKEIGRSVRWIERKRVDGEFPAPDEFNGRSPVWKAETVAAWKAANMPGDGASLEPVGDARPRGVSGTPDIDYNETDTERKFVGKSSKQIHTLEEAIAFAGADMTVWRVKKWGCTGWQVGMKLSERDDRGKILAETPHTENLWRVTVEFERILPKAWQDATAAIIARMDEHSPKYGAFKIRKQPIDPHMLELDLFDIHFGKLAWAPETGSNYDLRIAERVYKNALRDLLDRSAGFNIDKILIPIGNDFFHIDNGTNTTTSGTPQDVDGRLEKIVEVGFMSLVWCVELALSIPTVETVEVLRVPANHDWVTSMFLARELRSWYRHCDRVQVDISPLARKCRLYGENALGFTHGNEEKHADLPILMASEYRNIWAQARYSEIHVGHWHKAKELRTMPLETYGGVGVRFLMSLSGVDAWHYRRGFTLSQRAAECYLWGRGPGMAGHFTANVRED